MATADELLSTLDTDKTLIIDKDLRIITIPSSVKNLGVESDDDVLRLKFSMPRMYGDVDLSDFSIYINYMNAKNTGDVYVVDDKTIADDTITFSWLVGRVALAYKGNVQFIVCMKKHDDNSNVIQEYNTTIASLPVLEGLETGETVIQQNPDIIEMLLTSSEPLVGTTQTITPSQVLAAIKAGRDIALQHTDTDYGTFVFSAFNASEQIGIVVSNSILPELDGLTGTLLGVVENEGWGFRATYTATKDDVGTAVNEALAQAKASGEFDGADGLTPTIGDNGNWYLGATDTGKPSRGEKGDKGANGSQGPQGDIGPQGPQGEIGPKGDTGAQGPQGEQGPKGDTGDIGPQGPKGDTGATGAAGKSAYQYAQDGGYTGTEEQFAAKLASNKLPNPYALTFTGAVNETYDGSSAKTIEIPSGGGGGGTNLSLVYENTFENIAGINETIDALNGKENFVFNIEFTPPADGTTGVIMNNLFLCNGERRFLTSYYWKSAPYSAAYPKKAIYGSVLKLGEELWERILLKSDGTALLGDGISSVHGKDTSFQYLKDNQWTQTAAGLSVGFDQTVESVKVQIYAG